MSEERGVAQEEVFQGCGEHGAPKPMTTGLLLAILLLFGVLGALYGYSRVPETPYGDDDRDDRLGFVIFATIMVVAVYVESSRQRNSKTVHPVLNNDGSFHFRTADFAQDHVESMKIRRSLFSDLVKVHVHLKNGKRFQYTCPREIIPDFTNHGVPYKVDHRLNRQWPLYLLCLLCVFDYGMFLGSGKSFFLFIYQLNF